jgi:Kef-type K+ transport system membrane component KefB
VPTDENTSGEGAIPAPEPASFRVLLVTTVLVLPGLYSLYRSDLDQPGGPSPIVALSVMIPALPELLRRNVRNGKRALIVGLLAGLVATFILAALLGFNEDWADYVGIGFGTVVFDVVFWWVTRMPVKSPGASQRS